MRREVLLVLPLPVDARFATEVLRGACEAWRARYGVELPTGQMVTEVTAFGPAVVLYAPPPPSRTRFVCPDCGRGSAHPDDARHGYCGACHTYTGQDRDDTGGGMYHMSMSGALGSEHDRDEGTPNSALMGVPVRPFDGGGDARL